jgi:hypothetical protein
MVAALVCWYFEAFLFIYYNKLYYNKFCPAPMMKSEDGGALGTLVSVVVGGSKTFL